MGLKIINFCSTPNAFLLLVYFPQGWPSPRTPLQIHLPEERISAEWSPEQAPLQHSPDKIWLGNEKWRAPPLEHHGPGPARLELYFTFLKPYKFSLLQFRCCSSPWRSQKSQGQQNVMLPGMLCPVSTAKDWVSFCPAVFEFGFSNALAYTQLLLRSLGANQTWWWHNLFSWRWVVPLVVPQL